MTYAIAKETKIGLKYYELYVGGIAYFTYDISKAIRFDSPDAAGIELGSYKDKLKGYKVIKI